jgi:hypothetical protein
VLAAAVPGNDVVESESTGAGSAVLARVTIPTEHLALGQSHARTGAMNHIPQPDHRWLEIILPNGLDIAATVQQHLSFAFK